MQNLLRTPLVGEFYHNADSNEEDDVNFILTLKPTDVTGFVVFLRI